MRILGLLFKLPQLQTINLSKQKVYSLERAVCVLDDDMTYCGNRQSLNQEHDHIFFKVPLTLTMLNFSSGNDYFNNPPDVVEFVNAQQLKILDVSYGALGHCNTTIKGLQNIQVRTFYPLINLII